MPPILPLIVVIVVIVVGLGWRLPRHRRQYGTRAVAIFRDTKWSARVTIIAIAALAVLLAAQAIAWAIWPQTLSLCLIARPHAVAAGILIGIGLAFMFRAQHDMGASWRVGIDRAARPGLVAQGLYRISRNPIYLGVFTILGGFLLLMPTPWSVGVLLGLVLALRWQIRCEETYLLETYGTEYRQYAQRVGRFVPWVGRLK